MDLPLQFDGFFVVDAFMLPRIKINSTFIAHMCRVKTVHVGLINVCFFVLITMYSSFTRICT